MTLRREGRTGAVKWCAAVPSSNTLTCFPGIAGDLSHAAKRAHDGAMEAGYNLNRQYYDSSASIYTEFVRLGVNYTVRPIGFGG